MNYLRLRCFAVLAMIMLASVLGWGQVGHLDCWVEPNTGRNVVIQCACSLTGPEDAAVCEMKGGSIYLPSFSSSDYDEMHDLPITTRHAQLPKVEPTVLASVNLIPFSGYVLNPPPSGAFLIDVPAIQWQDEKPTCHEHVQSVISCSTESGVCFGGTMTCEREVHYSCADKSRILLTAENGTRHCVKF